MSLVKRLTDDKVGQLTPLTVDCEDADFTLTPFSCNGHQVTLGYTGCESELILHKIKRVLLSAYNTKVPNV